MATIISNSIYKTDSKAISCSKQFSFSTDNQNGLSNPLVFQAPSYRLISREVKSIGLFVHFTIPKSDLELINKAGLEIHHIAEYIQDLSSRNFSYNGCRMYVYIQGNSALIIVKRITDYLFAQIFNYESANDLLYYIQACFQSLKLDKSIDQLMLCGEIEPDSKIARLISIYYSNLITDSTLPLTALVLL